MIRLIQTAAVSLILLAFSLPALGYLGKALRGSDDVSATEKRVLTGLPRFEGDIRAFTAAFDAHLEDHFGFRMLMIRTARKVQDTLGQNPPDVVVGKEGWLFLGSHEYRDEFEGRGQWYERQVDRWIDSFSGIKAALNEEGIPFAAFIAADKARIYPEYLPDDWQKNPRRFRSAVQSDPQASQVGLIDAEPLILERKAQGEPVFYQRDTHWTANGSYDVAMAVLNELDPDAVRPRYKPTAPTQRRFERPFDLESLLGQELSQEPPKAVMAFPPGRENYLTNLGPSIEQDPLRGQFRSLKILGTEDAPDGRLVIVGDSFADTMIGHFRPSFSEIVRIHHGAQFFDVGLDEVLAFEPDAVLFATAERQAVVKAQPFLPTGP